MSAAAAPSRLPTGTVTLVFTDVAGSTELLRRLGPAYAGVLHEHRELLRAAAAAHGGAEVDTQGDAFFFAFPTAAGAVAAAAEAQRALAGADWPEDGDVRVRVGVHTGEPERTDSGYVGIDVHRAARIAAAAHGGQVVLSRATRDLLPPEVEAVDLGEHRLKDIEEPVRLFQLEVPGLEAEFPPLRTLHASNLPRPSTPLVGRDGELAALRELLDAGRVVTLTGPGGAGKTRLAIEAGARALEDYPGGAYFVDLAPVRDPEHVPAAVASALGVRETPGTSPPDALAAHLEGVGRALLVLDNVEHVVAAAPFVAELVAAAPETTVLATSREALRIRSEREVPVGPLPVDAGTALFSERARAVRPDLEDEPEVLEEIVRRLDCLALPIELAAAQTRTLPPRALLQRLERRLAVLTGGYADAPERHRALRATLDWSYDLLEPHEQDALARLGIFVGGFDLDAAAAVLDVPDAHAAVASLVEKSLAAPQGAGGESPRFLLLETIREYALERLDERGARDETAARHEAYYVALAERAAAALLGEERGAWLRVLAADRPNLRAAIRCALAEEDAGAALRLTGSLWRFWHAQGELAEGRGWLERALNRPGGPADARGRALAGATALAAISGDLAAAGAYASAHVEAARSLGDDRQLATALAALANIRVDEGEVEEADRLYDEAAAAARRSGDLRAAASVTGNVGYLALGRGDPVRAGELLDEALELFRKLGDGGGVVVALVNLGYARLGAGRTADAARVYVEALTLLEELGDRESIAYCLDGVARILLDAEDPAGALRLVAAARSLREETGASLPPYEQAVHDETRAQAAQALGDAAEGVEAAGAALGAADAVAEAKAVAGTAR